VFYVLLVLVIILISGIFLLRRVNMKIKSMVSIFVYVLIVSAVMCNAAEDKVKLKLQLKAGESHEMKMSQTQNITQTMMGQTQDMNQTQVMVMEMKCLSVDAAGNMDIEMTYKSMKMAIDGPMGRMEFDSEHPKPADPNKPDQQMFDSMFTAITGSKFQMKTSPSGKTSDVRGLKEMLAKIKTKMSSQAVAPPAEFLDKMFDEKQVKELTGSMIDVFSPEPVAVGDSWYDTMSINFIVPIDVDTTYILKQRKDGVAYIDKTAKIDMGDSSKPIDIDPNNKVAMQLSGTMNASSQVEEKTGLTRKSEMTMNFTGVMKMEANQQMPGGMSIPMTVKGNAVIEMIK